MKAKAFLPAAAIAALAAGCSSYNTVPRSELQSDAQWKRARVATFDGFEYRFDRIVVRADTLEGYYSETVERSAGREEVWYEDVERVHRIPIERVARLDLVRKDPVKTALYGASIAAAGYFLVSIADRSSPPSSGGSPGGGGKPPPGGP